MEATDDTQHWSSNLGGTWRVSRNMVAVAFIWGSYHNASEKTLGLI